MNVFGHYARYYDLLYQDKDYLGEVAFVCDLLQRHILNATSILELGCGTGLHAKLLVEKGYTVCGIDQSQSMLEKAQARVLELPTEQTGRLHFHQGDVRSFRTDQRFDVVISLFHVMSYQTTNQDLEAAFATARHHLKHGGIFLFDCWYGPAVLSNRPTVRVKRLEDDLISVTRIAEPLMYPNENRVNVNYQILIQDRQMGTLEVLKETHQMRYLFKPEVEWLFAQNGFICEALGEWMTHDEPGWQTWGTYFVGRC
ncbi:class I SAM-dependent methyltransferase [Phormidium sp. CLA17]|uniref:class I SAM-dependent DNA methyltransferase n=1 Tax=Leptolyngbya sp. Cla-17 TaxID=2803751 RepID=UPI001492DFC1|nr:class I SAM-dependent methyltransferase [Leptolyngbya sp. Cla-17]MBM0741146.1 class I SAM-dependent methyltransferase [Leptolyngbya sp. Cla-17]